MSFETRSMRAEDVPACTAIVNHIIGLGGSTAYEEPFTQAQFHDHYLEEPPVSNVVLKNGVIAGFQGAFDVGEGLLSIGSFTDRQNPASGAGRALFRKTRADCAELGAVAIIAKITSDNTGGLAYYTKMGFLDWKTIPNAHTRPNGVSVDHIIKRYDLRAALPASSL